MYTFLKRLQSCKAQLSKQQFKTIRGQALSGDIGGAEKGLNRILRRK